MTTVTRDQIRKKVVAYCEAKKAEWTDYPLVVEYPNIRTVDVNSQVNPYLGVTVYFDGGDGIGMGYGAVHRVYGGIILEVYTRKGAGMSKSNQIIDLFYRGIHNTDALYPLRTWAAGFTPEREADGWVAESAVIPFWYVSD